MGIKKKIALTARGYRTVHALVSGYLAVMGLQAVISSLLPFINIAMSAAILNALTAGRDFRSVLRLVLLTVALNLLTALASAGLQRLQDYDYAKFWRVYERPLNEKIERMDYDRVEDTRVHLLKQQILLLRQTNGLGLPKLIWAFTGLIQGLFTTLFSIFLLSGAFSSAHSRDAGTWGFLFSPAAVIGVMLLIAANIAISVRCTKRSTKKQMGIFQCFLPANRMGNYYYQYLLNYKAGKDLKLYALKKPILREFESFNVLCVRLMGAVQKTVAKYDGAAALSNSALTALIYGYVAMKALLGAFGVGSIVQYVGCLSQLSAGVSGVMENFTLLDVNAAALALLFDFVDMPDQKYRGTLPVEKRSDNEYEIEFHNVSFRYPGADSYALRDLSLKLNIGRRLAVVGRNGSGKTTMIKLLCRLYDPTEGEITLNGIDIRKYDYTEYLRLFGIVFQDFQLFPFPLGQNVAAGVDCDTGKATEALKKAGFAKRLSSLSKGLETSLYKEFDETGVEISGGEAQKIALARALYKDAPFMVLDEPTAALDPVSEYEIYSKFNEIVGNKTAVFISHRLSSCRFCDDIAVLEKGRLIQRGNHEQLVQDTEGAYFALWNAQAQYYTDKAVR